MTIICFGCDGSGEGVADTVCDLCGGSGGLEEFTLPAPRIAEGQHHVDSAIEVAVNIAIGAGISLAAQVIIFPLYGIHVGTGTHLGIVAAFTVVSVARQYILRRLFNGKSPYRYFREKFQ